MVAVICKFQYSKYRNVCLFWLLYFTSNCKEKKIESRRAIACDKSVLRCSEVVSKACRCERHLGMPNGSAAGVGVYSSGEF